MEHEPNYGLEILRISTMLRRCADNSMEIRQTQNLTGSNGWNLITFIDCRPGKGL